MERRGRPPVFLSVSLVQRLAMALAHAPASAPPLDASLDFEGRVEVQGGDVASAAQLLEQLGAAQEPELARLLNEARTRALDAATFARRLGHWLIKQHQLFPERDLVREWLAWLYPRTAPRRADPAVAEWLERETLAVPSRTPGSAGSARAWVALALLAIGASAFAIRSLLAEPPLEQPTPLPSGPPRPLPPPPPPPPPRAASAPAPLQVPTTPELPRWHSGPGTATLSGETHGIDLREAGLALEAPAESARWALRLTVKDPKHPPPYAALFVLPLGPDGHPGPLGVVGTSWRAFDAKKTPTVRVFAVQPDAPPDEGTFGLDLGREQGSGFAREAARSRDEVFTDAMAQQEGRRLIFDDLDQRSRYRLQLAAEAPPELQVVASVTAARPLVRSFRGDALLAKGMPLDQALLQPGVPLEVQGVRRLSFVALTTPETRGLSASVTVSLVSSKSAPTPPRMSPSAVRDGAVFELEGNHWLEQREPRRAAEAFRRCLAAAPRNAACAEGLRTTERLLQ